MFNLNIGLCPHISNTVEISSQKIHTPQCRHEGRLYQQERKRFKKLYLLLKWNNTNNSNKKLLDCYSDEEQAGLGPSCPAGQSDRREGATAAPLWLTHAQVQYVLRAAAGAPWLNYAWTCRRRGGRAAVSAGRPLMKRCRSAPPPGSHE